MSCRKTPKKLIIAIDGPAGAGKSTIARMVARRLGMLYIDTGAMYRALTLKALNEGIDIGKPRMLVKLSRQTKIELKNNPNGSIKVLLDGRDVSTDIRQPRITQVVSDVAKIPGVRSSMLVLQRRMGLKSSCVLDGRDIGTVVFPEADKKFFLDADFIERVSRRHKEHKGNGVEISFQAIEKDLKNRDTIDSTRKCAPLKKAKDAIYVDTTHMSIAEVASTLLEKIKM